MRRLADSAAWRREKAWVWGTVGAGGEEGRGIGREKREVGRDPSTSRTREIESKNRGRGESEWEGEGREAVGGGGGGRVKMK